MRFKKKYGQHFLTDKNIAKKITNAFLQNIMTTTAIEIGPGHGILTHELFKTNGYTIKCIDIDPDCTNWLIKQFPEHSASLVTGDFLEYEIKEPVSILGNFPYNISSQIVFKILQEREKIPLLVGMFQKEVAERIVSKPNNKAYGILGVLTQAFYTCECLFTVDGNVFQPPPKVKSTVIKLIRNDRFLSMDEYTALKYLVKKAFGQRRKMLRNSLAEFSERLPENFKTKRPEQLTVNDFIEISNICRKK